MIGHKVEYHLRTADPNFQDLPWGLHLSDWETNCDRLVEVPHGVHRHPVVFVNYAGVLYSLKEAPLDLTLREYALLLQAEALELPAVSPVGYVIVNIGDVRTGVLITRFLVGSLPYRVLLSRQGFEPYRSHLLDALAGLLVEMHLCGVFWGDCSLSNTLYRRDAGELRAYIVDMETAEHQPGHTRPTLRFHDLQIMEENVNVELRELQNEGVQLEAQLGMHLSDTGGYIRLRYQDLWDQVTREDVLSPGEHYRIQERVRALNRLGFSVGDIDLVPAPGGNQVFLRVIVSDRHFHHDRLHELTGLDAEEMQAQKIMNEIQEVRARLSNESGRNTPLNVAAQHWLEYIYRPAAERLSDLAGPQMTLGELYCQILEHKWYLSERAQYDVGHQAAIEDYLKGWWFQQRLDL